VIVLSTNYFLLKQNALVLLDLIGADNPVFYNSFRETDDLFQRMEFIGMYCVFQIKLMLFDWFT